MYTHMHVYIYIYIYVYGMCLYKHSNNVFDKFVKNTGVTTTPKC